MDSLLSRSAVGRKRGQGIGTPAYRVNRQIRSPSVRLIDGDGTHVGIVTLDEALHSAQEADLDLVEISPAAEPPVVRVMDHGKFQYERTKKAREARKAQKQVEVKEIRLRPKTTDHHRSFKVKDARRWLQEGKKVKVRIRFRGREITYPEIALETLSGVATELSDVAAVEQTPQRDGRTMLMVLAPK
ncbi:MAG: translation initiation factor IF-3 [Ardenticatenales bacterium]|nr:translation initiation factor IF-3 [Ardenticatenales bacterium]